MRRIGLLGELLLRKKESYLWQILNLQSWKVFRTEGIKKLEKLYRPGLEVESVGKQKSLTIFQSKAENDLSHPSIGHLKIS